MDWTLGLAAIVMLTVGLAGQAFEMRRMRTAASGDAMGSPNLFLDRRNIKWYAVIGTAIILWYAAERGAGASI